MGTMREARLVYFRDNGLPDDGGYTKWIDVLWLGRLPLPIPNPPARRRALPYHDMSHVLSGYKADWRGEFEESAYEVASGCGSAWLAWLINYQGFLGGLLLSPTRTRAAWLRGARSGSLYDRPVAETLDADVDSLRRELGLDRAPSPWTDAEIRRHRHQTVAAVLLAAAQAAVVAGVLFGAYQLFS